MVLRTPLFTWVHASPDGLAVDAVWGNKRGDGEDARLGSQLGDLTHPADVLGPILGAVVEGGSGFMRG